MTRKMLLMGATALLLPACEVSQKPADGTVEMSAQGAVDTAADEQAIRSNVDRWLQLVKAGDAAGISQLYSEEGVLMAPNAPVAKGRAAVRQAWASMMQTPGFDLTFAPEEIVFSSSGDMALDRGTYRLAFTSDGTAQTDTGKYVVVWRKVGGDWKAAADIFNSDLPAGG